MKNNFDELFDEQAKNLFQNFEMDFNPQDWTKIERQLNQSDEKFDANARQKLENYEMPYNKQDWAKMETILDKNRRRLPYFWFYKTLEFSFVSLLLLSTALLYSDKSDFEVHQNLAANNNSKTANNNSTAANNNSNAANNNSKSANNNSNAANNNSKSANNNSNAANNNSNAANNNSNAANNNSKSANNNSKSPNNNSNAANNNSNAANNNSKLANNNSNTANNNSNVANNNSNLANNNSKSANNNSKSANNNSNAANNNSNAANNNSNAANNQNELLLLKNAEIANKIQPENGNGDENENLSAASLKKVKLTLPFIRQMRLAAVLGMETHTENSLGRGVASFLAGASLETDINRHFALSFGLHYARRNYELELNSQETRPDGLIFSKKELRNTHLSLLQIPVALQTNVFRNEKWRVYLTSGLNASLIFDKTYSGTLQISAAQTAGNLRMQSNISPREYEGGLFQTGNFVENAFLTAQIGVGAERQLTDHFSLFIQPTYQISFTRFGQNRQDKTRVISLNVGLKTNF